ncbi:methylated-DNA--protein-cysteine methyltransferase PWA37_000908 [Arxiozyma heterogenica]|uniref:Methylated-DNA--protein-cysteine methyltransferase n=1 Tax=Arxiozyma heterogenica TaxID=278026 RepID=A0AAN7WMI4_9SACH|nr:hypothetical protein RI543_002823 [Kazachstania heterogenica]
MKKYGYTFIEGEITDALIIIDYYNCHLVYAALGRNKFDLLKTAKSDFNKLYSKSNEKYNLIPLRIDKEKNGSMDNTDIVAIKQLIDDYRNLLNSVTFYYNTNIKYDIIFGTPFQRKVWNQLHKLTPGKTISYGQLAKSTMGKPNGQRAIARACASNKLALIIPCHFVVDKNGNFKGYRWGVDIKRKLLDKLSSK